MKKHSKAVVIFSITCVVVSILLVYLSKWIAESKSVKYGFEEVDKYSSYFASVSNWISGIAVPVFTLGSVILLYLTFRTQKEEFQNTNEALKKQQFDSTFFNMINLHNNIVENIKFGDDTSRKALESLWSFFIGGLEESLKLEFVIAKKNKDMPDDDLISFRSDYDNEEYVAHKFETFSNNNNPSLGHYFRNMYRIIKFIETSNLSESEKRNYRGIFRAQLSASELYLLFFNINYSRHGKNFYELLKGTEFFEDHVRELIKEGATLYTLNNKKYESLL